MFDKNHIFYALIPYRYLLLLMGIFAFYCGWIYNDFMSIGLNSFGSCYTIENNEPVYEGKGCVYPFGI